jgi:hypothetical protein
MITLELPTLMRSDLDTVIPELTSRVNANLAELASTLDVSRSRLSRGTRCAWTASRRCAI